MARKMKSIYRFYLTPYCTDALAYLCPEWKVHSEEELLEGGEDPDAGQQSPLLCLPSIPPLPSSQKGTFNKIQKPDLVELNAGSPWQPSFGGYPKSGSDSKAELKVTPAEKDGH
ncbi:hypothetical protein CB1_000370030 [Camelus ferus]|nr:hypothetical protein CB1_000370030 [Camelus ferus]